MDKIFNQFRSPLTTVTPEASDNSDCYRGRYNYMTLANMTELASNIVSDVVDDSKGISGKVGEATLSRTDISDLFVTRLMGSVKTSTGAV